MSRSLTRFLTAVSLLLPLALIAADPPPAPAPATAAAQADPKPEENVPLPPNTKLEENIPYVAGGHERQVLDIYVPEGQGPFPFVLYLHGGGLKIGSKAWARKEAVNNLIPAGIAVVAMNYRYVKDAPFPAQMEDTLAASKWLKAHGAEHGLDVTRAGTWGYSAGAMLSGLLATTEDAVTTFAGADAKAEDYLDIRAAVIWAGRADLTHTGPMIEKELKIVAGYFGGKTIEEHLDLAKKASAVNYISAQDAPTFIVHGDQDIHANVAQVEIWKKALEAASVPVEVDINEGSTHDIPKDYDYAKLVAFLKKNLAVK